MNEIEDAVACLRAGGGVAFPPETVYGLGADARNAAAVRRLFAIKGRPADHPLIVHLASADQALYWAAGIPEMARRLMVRTALGGQVDRMLDGGPCRWGLESTIVSLLNA